MYLNLFLCVCLCTLSLSCLLAKWIPALRSSVLAYGKLQQTADQPQSKLGVLLGQCTVPKSWFAHFYVVGLVFALICAAEISAALQWQKYGVLLTLLRDWDNPRWCDRVPLTECLIGLAMMTAHLTRRVYESFWIENPSRSARMHVFHYLAGLGFYGAMVLGTWIEGAVHLGLWTRVQSPPPFLHLTTLLRTLMALVTFWYASIHQHRCHKILASLRQYQIPRGDWFEWIVTPHYFADILVYFSLCLLYGFRNLILICGLLWALLNLSVTAGETEVWYQKKFENYNATFPRRRWRIIPFLY